MELFIAPAGTTTMRIRYVQGGKEKVAYRAVTLPIEERYVNANVTDVRKIADRWTGIQHSFPDVQKTL